MRIKITKFLLFFSLLCICCQGPETMQVFEEAMNKRTRVITTEPLDASSKNFSQIFTDTHAVIKIDFTNTIYETSVSSYSFAVCSVNETEESPNELDYLFNLKNNSENNLYNKELYTEIKDILEEINTDPSKSLCSKPIEGDITIQNNRITFTPRKELESGKTYLILINGIIDEKYSGVSPYIGSFNTLPDETISENIDTIREEEIVTEEVVSIPITENNLIINEILADPPDEALGDANQDGTRSSTQDEFIEIYNTQDRDIDLFGVTIAIGSETTIKHEFKSRTIIPAQGFIVLFSGGNFPITLNGSQIIKSDRSLSLSNSGTSIFLIYNNTIINSVTYGTEGGKNQSLTRIPPFGNSFGLHSEVYPNILFSPGYNP